MAVLQQRAAPCNPPLFEQPPPARQQLLSAQEVLYLLRIHQGGHKSAGKPWREQQEVDASDARNACDEKRPQPGGARCLSNIQKAFHLFPEPELVFLMHQLHKEAAMHQRGAAAAKRLLLVDYLVEVVDEFRLSQEALFLAVQLLDAFAAVERVPATHLQLLGATCLWVAAKYEEVEAPSLQEVVDVTDNACSASDILRMEVVLLATLQYQLAVPTPLHFLQLLLAHAALEAGAASSAGSNTSTSSSSGIAARAATPSGRLAHLACYLLELGLLSPDTLAFPPSLVAAAALRLASDTLWGLRDVAPSARRAHVRLTAALADASAPGGAGHASLEDCVAELGRMHAWARRADRTLAVRDKYSDASHAYAAHVAMPLHLLCCST